MSDGPVHPVGAGEGPVRVPREQAGEFLPAHAADDSAGRHQGLGDPAEADEDGIAHGVAVGVVHALEMVEIEQQQGCGPVQGAQGGLRSGHEGPPVGDTRERVRVGGQALEALGPFLGQRHQDEGEGHREQHPEARQDAEGGRLEGMLPDGPGRVQDRHGNAYGVHAPIGGEENRGWIAGDQGLRPPRPDQGRHGEAETGGYAGRQDDPRREGGEEVRHQARPAPQGDAEDDRPRAQAPPLEGEDAVPDQPIGADHQGVGDADGQGIGDLPAQGEERRGGTADEMSDAPDRQGAHLPGLTPRQQEQYPDRESQDHRHQQQGRGIEPHQSLSES